MEPCNCQSGGGTRNQASQSAPWLRRGGELASWVAPAAALVFLPKCPACVAGYVALATGIGISLPTASWLRLLLVALCVGSLIFIAIRRVRLVLARKANRQAL